MIYAAQAQSFGWPEAIVAVAGIFALCFFLWLMTK